LSREKVKKIVRKEKIPLKNIFEKKNTVGSTENTENFLMKNTEKGDRRQTPNGKKFHKE